MADSLTRKTPGAHVSNAMACNERKMCAKQIIDTFCKSIINSFYSPSSSNVASVSRFNLLLRQDSGIPLLETVVNGTKQSGGKKVLKSNYNGSKVSTYVFIIQLKIKLSAEFMVWP